MAKATNVSTTFPSRFHKLSHLVQTCVQQLQRWTSNPARTTPDPKAWRVTRAGDVILPNRKIELRARRMAAA